MVRRASRRKGSLAFVLSLLFWALSYRTHSKPEPVNPREEP
jgi:hypothetical protein